MKFRDNLLIHMIYSYIADLEQHYGHNEASSLVYWLAEDFFGATRAKLILNPNWRLSESEMLKLHFAFKDLKRNKPVQYIVGQIPFLDVKLRVSPDVLIPRPETEELVDWIIKQEIVKGKNVLDAGTGSGCIALSLKKAWPDAYVWGYDKSNKAIEMANINAKLNDLDVVFFEADMNTELLNMNVQFDVVVSNPPYVLQSERKLMHPNVLDYEPHNALFVSDDDPLLFYRAILIQSQHLLKSKGRIYFEINEQLGNQMVDLLKGLNFTDIVVKKDLNGKTRFVSGVKKP